MDLLLLLIYAGLCVVIFKVFNVPLNKWTVPTAALGGVILVGGLVLLALLYLLHRTWTGKALRAVSQCMKMCGNMPTDRGMTV